MISGQQALQSIEQAAAQIRAQELDADRALRSANDELVRLRAERVATLKQLATVRLDALRSQPIAADLDVAERRALALLADSERAMDDLAKRHKAAQAARDAAQADQAAKAAALTQALAAIETLQGEAEPRIKAGPAWQEQQARIARAAAIVEQAERKASQSEADREAKRKPYEDDPLFMYLWQRRFGTPDYASGFFVRFFDRKVAALIDFTGARPNYVMLNAIPARLREHAERCKAALAAEHEKLVAVETEGLKAAGSGPLEERVAAARAALVAAETQLKTVSNALAILDRERQDALVGNQDAAWRKAVDLLAEADGRQDVRELAREAAATRTPEDDALVRRIAATDAKSAQAEQQVMQLRQAAGDLARRRVDIEQQRDSFRQRGYDNPYGQFGNEQVIGQVLGGILNGVITGTVLGQVLNNGYRERPRQADSNFGGDGGFTFPFPRGGGGGGGGGWSDGGWSGGGGGGGGDSSGGSDDGFTTGGQF